MNQRSLLALLLILLLFSCDKRQDNPYGLMLEFIRQPHLTRVMDKNPEFTWKVPSSFKQQEAYRILVASSPEILDGNGADLWDSDKVISNQSVEVEYNGSGLTPGKTYYWKVRIWGSNGNESGFSAVQKFTLGNPTGYSSTQNIFLEEKDHPVKFEKVQDNTIFADFEKAAFGKLSININTAKKDTLRIHLGEKVNDNGRIDRNPGGTIRYASVKLPLSPGKSLYSVPLKPDAQNTGERAIPLPDSFGVIMPFRFVEIENAPEDLDPQNLVRTSYVYYFENDQSYFRSSDTLLNQIWDLCKYSIEATSFTGLYVDGDRERIPYEADAYINQLGHYCVDREYSMARRTNEYFIHNPTWPTEWILFTVPLFWEDYLYTGNAESLRNYYDKLQYKTLTDLAREDGLISVKSDAMTPELLKNLGFDDDNWGIHDIVDWPPANKDTGWELATKEGERDGFEFRDINTVVNTLHFYNLKLMTEIANLLGKIDDAVLYEERARLVKKSINNKLLDHNKGIYIDGEGSGHSSLHANMFPLAFGLVPKEYEKNVTGFIKTRGMACSVYGSQLLLDGLYSAGESEYAHELLTATHDRSWWNMIRVGSTITLEAWDMKYKPNLDWNHAWGAAPANLIPRRMWGIRPIEPGFSKVIIEPQLENLEWSEIKVPTIRGPITGNYKKEGESFVYEIELPGNIEGEFLVRSKGFKKVINPGMNYILVK